MSTRELAVYVKREKVLLTGELIDDQNPTNELFEEKMKSRPPKSEEPVVVGEGGAPVVGTRKKKVVRPSQRKAHPAVTARFSLETKLKEVEIEKKQRESQLLQNKQDRAAGRLIPTALVKGLFQNQFKSIVMGFKQGLDQMIMEIAKKKSMNINERAELKKEMVKILNSCIDETIRISKRDISSLVAEYSQTSEE